MKHLYTLLTISLLFSTDLIAQYCTPPSYILGPFTAIKTVTVAGIDHETGTSDGYSDYTGTVDPAVISQGTNVTFDWSLYYDPALVASFSGSVNLRVWIDWNQDMDFEDAGETAIAVEVTQTGEFTSFSHTFEVPETAMLGETRMRVYEDMLVSDGHETPNPCGYDTGIGQHGECEDYTVNVTAAVAGIETISPTFNFAVFPNPADAACEIQFSLPESDQVGVDLVDLSGKQVYSSSQFMTNGFNQLTLDLDAFEAGCYILSVTSSGGLTTSKKLTIQ